MLLLGYLRTQRICLSPCIVDLDEYDYKWRLDMDLEDLFQFYVCICVGPSSLVAKLRGEV
jgi:hypothetical protein